MDQRRRRRRRGHIPTDLPEEILLRLPANDLLNCKCVCKDWLRLISGPQFMQKHLHRSKGSCDGLILCLVDKESNKLGVFNPSTGKSDVPIVDGIDFNMLSFYWFGHHPSTGDYVLVIGRTLLSPIRVGIEVYKFSLKLKSVLSCSIHRPIICFGDIGTLLHRNLHWAAAGLHNEHARHMVLAFDLEKNEILEIAGPRESYFTVGVVGGCLSAIFKPGEMFELWIMKDYGVEQSWTKYRNIEGRDKCSVPAPLSLSRNGHLVVDLDNSKLTRYNLSHKDSALLKDQSISREAILCTDSLVSPPLIWGE